MSRKKSLFAALVIVGLIIVCPRVDSSPLVTGGPYGGWTTIVNHPPGSDVFYATTSGAGVFKSVDHGQTWTRSNRGLSEFYLSPIAGDPLDANTLYVGAYNPYYNLEGVRFLVGN